MVDGVRRTEDDGLALGPTNTGTRPQVRKARFDGWTQARRQAFLQALSVSANITLAAYAAGIDRSNAYKLRSRDPGFRDAWDEALVEGTGFLEFKLLERAMNGDEKPYFFAGKEAGKYVEYPDRVAMFLVSRHRPKDGGGDRSSAHRLALLHQRQEAARARIEAKLAEIEQRRWDKDDGNGDAR